MSLAMTETLKCLKHFSAQCMKKNGTNPKNIISVLDPKHQLGKEKLGEREVGWKEKLCKPRMHSG